MISEARAHIEAQIRKCNANYKRIRDNFGDDDIAMSEVKEGFKLVFGTLNSEILGNYLSDTVSAELTLFKAVNERQEIEDHDTLFDLAIDIKNTVCDPIFAEASDANFNKVIPLGITPEPLQSNDKIIRILLTFQIVRNLAYEGV